MANRGPNTNTSQVGQASLLGRFFFQRIRITLISDIIDIDFGSLQWFILTTPASWCDGRNVVFGEVVIGMDLVYRIQSYHSDDILRRPSARIMIVASGVI